MKEKIKANLPQLIISLEHNYYLQLNKQPNFIHSTSRINELYSVYNNDKIILVALFKYILELQQQWIKNNKMNSFNIKSYIREEDSSIMDLF